MAVGTTQSSPLPNPITHDFLGDDAIEDNNIKDGEIVNSHVNASASIAESKIAISFTPPIGSIMPWAKTLGTTHTPALPTGWVECDGAVLSDGASVYDGDTMPDLNTTQSFLRGASTSGGTGGADTVAHTHSVSTTTSVPSASNQDNANAGSYSATGSHTHTISVTSGATSDNENMPVYYQVVYIIRVK